LLAFCLLWFLGNLVIESSVIGIEIIYEHRLYLPSMMIFLLLTYAGYKTIPFKWARGAVVVAVLLTLSFWTYQRNQVWRSDVGFWKDCARKSPNDARPLQNIAYSLQQKDLHEEAVAYYRQSLDLEKDPGAFYNMGISLSNIGYHLVPATCLLKLSKQYPENPELQFKMAYLREGERKIKNAISGYQKVLTLMPESDRQLYLMTLNHLATCFLMIGDMDQAMPLFLKGASLSPADYKFHYQLAALYSYKGDADAAFSWLEKAVDKGFSDPDRFESDTRFNGVRDEPRFKRLKNTMGTRSE
jgi:tetratricopeptide (TPR) repeat protein